MNRGRKSVAEMQMQLLRDKPPASAQRPDSREEFAVRAKGYTPHDGGPMPHEISGGCEPGVVFDDGSFLQQGTRRADYIDWSRVRGWKLRNHVFQSPGLAFGTRKGGK